MSWVAVSNLIKVFQLLNCFSGFIYPLGVHQKIDFTLEEIDELLSETINTKLFHLLLVLIDELLA